PDYSARARPGRLAWSKARPRAPASEQGLGRGWAAAKGPVSLVVVAGAAGGVDKLLEALSHGRIENVAGLLERLEPVSVEHLRPEIAVVGGRVAARENMLEMRRAVTHGDRLGHADPLEFFPLERNDVEVVR